MSAEPVTVEQLLGQIEDLKRPSPLARLVMLRVVLRFARIAREEIARATAGRPLSEQAYRRVHDKLTPTPEMLLQGEDAYRTHLAAVLAADAGGAS